MSTKVCFYYLKGSCKFGSKCCSVHPLNRSDVARQYEKKNTLSICKFYLHGTCNKEDHCQYLHCRYGDCNRKDHLYTHELQDTSTVQCRFYAEGRCHNGDHCKFAHGGDDHDDYDDDLDAFCEEMYAAELNDVKLLAEGLLDLDEEIVGGPDGDYIVEMPLP